jgi:hypothetical protein
MTESQKALAERYGTPAQVMAALGKLAPLLEGSNRKANIALQSYQAEWEKAGKEDRSQLTEVEATTLAGLRLRGWAAAVISPVGLNGKLAGEIEAAMCDLGHKLVKQEKAEKPEAWLAPSDCSVLYALSKRGWAVAAIPPAKLGGADNQAVAKLMLELGLANVADSRYALMHIPRSQVEIDKAQADTLAAVAAKQDKDLIDKMDEILPTMEHTTGKPAPTADADKTVKAILLNADENGYNSFQIVQVPAYSSSDYVEKLLGEAVTYGVLYRVCEDSRVENVCEIAYSVDRTRMIRTRKDYLSNSLASSLVRAFTRDNSLKGPVTDFCIGKALILGRLGDGKSDTGVPVSERLDVPQHVIDLVQALHTTLFEG